MGNELRKLAKKLVAEEIGQGNEIILTKIGQGNELKKLCGKKAGKFIAKNMIYDLVIKSIFLEGWVNGWMELKF